MTRRRDRSVETGSVGAVTGADLRQPGMEATAHHRTDALAGLYQIHSIDPNTPLSAVPEFLKVGGLEGLIHEPLIFWTAELTKWQREQEQRWMAGHGLPPFPSDKPFSKEAFAQKIVRAANALQSTLQEHRRLAKEGGRRINALHRRMEDHLVKALLLGGWIVEAAWLFNRGKSTLAGQQLRERRQQAGRRSGSVRSDTKHRVAALGREIRRTHPHDRREYSTRRLEHF